MAGKTICLDFDGVCNMYDGWKGEDELFEPRPGIMEFIGELIDRGKRVAVFSTRSADKLRAWFMEHSLEARQRWIESGALFFPDKKPPAECYIDDRAVRFNGSFSEILPCVLDFKAFWEEKDSLKQALANNSSVTIDSGGRIW